jgi:hypothetical protein
VRETVTELPRYGVQRDRQTDSQMETQADKTEHKVQRRTLGPSVCLFFLLCTVPLGPHTAFIDLAFTLTASPKTEADRLTAG